MELRATLKEKKRIVIKVGTSTVTYAKTGNINLEKLEKFVRVLINLRNRGKEIIVVSPVQSVSGKMSLESVRSRLVLSNRHVQQ